MSETRRWLDRFTREQRASLLAWVWNTQDEGALLLDGDGRVLDANRAACALLESDRDALVGPALPAPPPRGALWEAARRPPVGPALPAPPLDDDAVRVRTHVRAADALGELRLVT